MKSYLAVFLVILTYGTFGYASTKCIETKGSSCNEKLKYSDRIGERYRTFTILRDGKTVRVLRGDVGKGGTFERIDHPILSPDGNIVLLSQIESGEVETSNGSKTYHEVAYCELVDLRNGCIIARETGEFCGGTFSQDGRWENSLYPEFSLTTETPRAKYYADGTQIFADSPAASFDNLLFCDPPDTKNKNDYHIIIEKHNFKLDSAQRELLK
ncbi:hypothetical protein [Pseudomonas umsongensis]|jgi:hypothetical protein|uniref:Uncharacterized protein n=1 Tax=Pseudomonas umsongensis TaxID=198618 RepID=A0AAE6ZZC4_9PSED|nr:hypothetical protein [Pseudomonas umsongensis]QJC80889.1 hypothetical protein HGP31_22145 [Pseudomonas umsongensis]